MCEIKLRQNDLKTKLDQDSQEQVVPNSPLRGLFENF